MYSNFNLQDFLLGFILILYFYTFLISLKKRHTRISFLRKFHNAILTTYNTKIDLPDKFAVLSIDYHKLTQNTNGPYKSVLDLLQTIMHHYDTCSDFSFRLKFHTVRDRGVYNYILDLCFYISHINPFISVPEKEAQMLTSLKEALETGNKSLGINSLNQLTVEIENKEKIIDKKDRDNRNSLLVSIVGIILTIFFGLTSISKF